MVYPTAHEQLLADNSLVIFDQSLGQAMFISHEWSGRSHPEPRLGEAGPGAIDDDQRPEPVCALLSNKPRYATHVLWAPCPALYRLRKAELKI